MNDYPGKWFDTENLNPDPYSKESLEYTRKEIEKSKRHEAMKKERNQNE